MRFANNCVLCIMNEIAPIKVRTVRLGGAGHFHLAFSAQKAKAFRRRCERIVRLTVRKRIEYGIEKHAESPMS